ncbi:uncharacterized protein BDZ99DRAFT_485054 [Mytilinidion resinicola]|uniref:Uncharacterized protein n=1 Tax=Mytilinidion resinicola TaxID=574789 RepID=A0A6A6Z5Q9_9PEZI|nr:uncharacterized protein BDZ99DRAFT_485054 [Mytilinidion resinicola]KAF2816442.1 hypothetical protein BDZ99DRAFT_485054 [Mytilinidion resinicola]
MASKMPPSQASSGPPWLPTVWALGGKSELHIDVPITAVLLLFYVCGAATHMTIFQLNRRRGHKFLFSAVLFGFCMARTVTCILRISSICKPHNIRLAIAASIFVAAGVLLIFVINLVFTQRLLRAAHPHFGWHRALSLALKAIYVLIVLTLAIVITGTVESFYTLRPRTRKIDRSLQLYGSTFLAIISFLPIPMVIFGLLVPRKTRVEKFGQGRFRTKVIVLLLAAFSVTLGAWYRCGTSWKTPVPRTEPLPGYFSRACFYVFNFVVEILVVYLYAILRIDLRFHIPDGAKGPGSYAAGQKQDGDKEEQGRRISRVYTEEETSLRPLRSNRL